VAGTGLTTYTISDVTISDDKRVTGVDEHNVFALANAFYHRQAAEWRRKDTGRPAWAIELDADTGQNYLRVLRAVAAANPITWVEVFRIAGVTTPANYLDVLLAAAGAEPEIRAQGSDADVDVGVRPKGAGLARILANPLRLAVDPSNVLDAATKQYVDATGSGTDSPFRIIRGRIDTTTPTILQGVGFTLVRNGTGDATVTFTTAYGGIPAVVATADRAVGATGMAVNLFSAPTTTTARFQRVNVTPAVEDGVIDFIAIGPR